MWYLTNNEKLINLDHIDEIFSFENTIVFMLVNKSEILDSYEEKFETVEEAQKKFKQLKKKLLLSNSTIMLGTPKFGQPAGQLICGK